MKNCTSTVINIQGEPREAFEVYADETKEQTIAFVFDGNQARLIASAPELLQACELAKEFIGNGIKIINDNEPDTTFEEISQMHAVLFSAIYKAKGN